MSVLISPSKSLISSRWVTYVCLYELINLDTTYSCKMVIITIGSTGCVYRNVVPGLKILGFDTRRSNAIAKYLSISAAIGSKIVCVLVQSMHCANLSSSFRLPFVWLWVCSSPYVSLLLLQYLVINFVSHFLLVIRFRTCGLLCKLYVAFSVFCL